MSTTYEIADLDSGECRWIGRHDIHVYCRHPFVETMMPTGRMGWSRQPADARYCVVCDDAGLERGNWLTLEQATAVVDSLVPADERRMA